MHYPMASGATRAQGDANSDGAVTGYDFLIWQANYQPAGGTAVVPEPDGALLVLAGLAQFCRAKGWRKKRGWDIIPCAQSRCPGLRATA